MPRFFGLSPSDKEIFLEHIFALMYYCGFTYNEVYNIPIWQRVWFIKRLNKEIKRANDQQGDASTRAAHHNSPDTRAMQGRMRNQVPANLRRFT